MSAIPCARSTPAARASNRPTRTCEPPCARPASPPAPTPRALQPLARSAWQPLDAGLARSCPRRPAHVDGSVRRLARRLEPSPAGRDTQALGRRTAGNADCTAPTGWPATSARLAAQLRAAVVHDGQAPRTLLLGGAALAAAAAGHDAVLRAARPRAAGRRPPSASARSTTSSARCAKACSWSTATAASAAPIPLRCCAAARAAPAGQTFEDLLRPLVDDKTLQAASTLPRPAVEGQESTRN